MRRRILKTPNPQFPCVCPTPYLQVVDGVSEARATPNAFSHFTWEASNNSILVCDIQGVEDFYTDPQIHTVSGKGFGRGNLGQAGLTAFMTRHRCTHVCEFLGLKRLGKMRNRTRLFSDSLLSSLHFSRTVAPEHKKSTLLTGPHASSCLCLFLLFRCPPGRIIRAGAGGRTTRRRRGGSW